MPADIYIALGPSGVTDYRKLQVNAAGELLFSLTGVGTPSSAPLIYNVTTTLAGTEYSQLLPVGTKKLTLRARGLGILTFSFVLGQSATLFMTLESGVAYEESGLNLSVTTVYFTSDTAGEIVEILVWT